MTMVSSGPISLGGTATSGGLNQSVNVELGYSGTAQISMNDSAVRTLAGAGGSGTQYSMSSFYGKSNQFAFTISTNQTNANLRTLAVNAGWNQSSKVVATISSGVYVYSTSTGTPGLTINGSFPGGVELINNGIIAGMGGAGGKGTGINPYAAGSAGGLALSVSVAVSINNASGTIGGGGGGGGGSDSYTIYYPKFFVTTAGAGGGGGRVNGAGGAADGQAIAGNAGSLTAAGTGKSNSGAAGVGYASGGGGGFGSNGSAAAVGGAGGAAGGAVSGNSNITWLATGTRLGSIT